MFIKKILIKNFRSVTNQIIESNGINIIVGNNDTGKSNFLKALNLFFNGFTDTNSKFDFESDFCLFALRGKGKAKEIVIELILVPPTSYNNGKAIKWRKIWRSKGLWKEVVRYADNKPLMPKTRVRDWLNSIVFRYVPAVKDVAYFSELLRYLHDTLSLTIEDEVKAAGKGFISNIKKHTQKLDNDILMRLGIKSSIQLPPNLRDLFSTLDFQTTNYDKEISLRHRGDGIKARYIPIILKFLADHEKLYHPQGAALVNTIWGYEEPENNLELLKQFELISEFIDYSKKAQIFLTTHSPVFYSIGKSCPEVFNTFHASIDRKSKSTHFDLININRDKVLDKHMGLLPLIAPYIKKQQEEVIKLKKTLEDLENNGNKAVVFVEGETDRVILNNAWRKLYRKKPMDFLIKDAFDRHFIGNTFLREDIFKNYPNRKFIGMLDFDEAFENWHRIKDEKKNKWTFAIKNEVNGLLLKHCKFNGHVFLLPVPINRSKYASYKYGKKSMLSIELLFPDNKIKKFAEKVSMPGGATLLHFRDDKKTKFSELTSKFNRNDFNNFKAIFELIRSIISG